MYTCRGIHDVQENALFRDFLVSEIDHSKDLALGRGDHRDFGFVDELHYDE